MLPHSDEPLRAWPPRGTARVELTRRRTRSPTRSICPRFIGLTGSRSSWWGQGLCTTRAGPCRSRCRPWHNARRLRRSLRIRVVHSPVYAQRPRMTATRRTGPSTERVVAMIVRAAAAFWPAVTGKKVSSGKIMTRNSGPCRSWLRVGTSKPRLILASAKLESRRGFECR